MEKFNGKVKFKLEAKYDLANEDLEAAYLYYEEILKKPKLLIEAVDWLIGKEDIPSNYKIKCYIEINQNIYAIYTSSRTKRIIVMECEDNGEIGNGVKYK